MLPFFDGLAIDSMEVLGYCFSMFRSLQMLCLPSVAALLALSSAAAESDLLVLMSDAGRVERYDTATGAHVGTFLSGLPPSNELLSDAEGRLLVSTGGPGGDIALASPGGMTQIATHGGMTSVDLLTGYGRLLLQVFSYVRTVPHMQKRAKTTSDVPAFDRGLDVLEHLVERGGAVGLTEIAAAVGMPVNAVFRLTQALLRRGYVARDEETKRFRLTGKLLTLAQPRVADMNISAAALGPMRELRDRTRETVQLGVRSEDEGVVVERFNGLHALRIGVEVGLRFRLYCSGPGKVLLAFQPEPERTADIARLKLDRFTERTITNRKELLRECGRIVERGYATDMAETEEGIHCVAAPVFDRHGLLLATVWVSAPSRRMPKMAFAATAPWVVAAARAITAKAMEAGA